MSLTAYQAIGTGFEGVFSRRSVDAEQKKRILSLIEYFLPLLAPARPGIGNAKLGDDVIAVAKREFAHFTPPQQALLLFLRAIVSRPPLLILDEPSQGMDEVIWDKCRDLLKKEWLENPGQAVIVVSHYDDEVSFGACLSRDRRLTDRFHGRKFEERSCDSSTVMRPSIRLEDLPASWEVSAGRRQSRDSCYSELQGNVERSGWIQPTCVA
jgi:hypothetical protein